MNKTPLQHLSINVIYIWTLETKLKKEIMADVAKTYGIGDTVWVWYFESPLNAIRYVAQSRVVKAVKTNTSGNEALVTFTNGDSVTDGATPRVFDTAALASTAIVTAAIANTAAAVALDVTTSEASTGGQSSTTLGRVD